jgi:predicted permease
VFAELASIVAPIYLVVLLGYGWYRAGRRFDIEFITDLNMNVGAPCLVFASLSGVESGASELVTMAGATLAALASFAALGYAALRLAGLPAHTFLAPISFVNAGNMGLPLCLFAFGEEGLALAVVFFAVTALTHFTVGQWMWAGSANPGVLFSSPIAWAVVAAVVVIAADLAVPSWLERTTSLLGDFCIPLMQFSLGVSLARLELSDLPRSIGLAVLRTVLGLSVGIGLAELLGLEGLLRSVFILDCAMPAAVFNYMMAERYGRSPQEVASVVVISTLIAFVSVPLLLAWLLPVA